MAKTRNEPQLQPEPDFAEFRRRVQEDIDRLPVGRQGTLKRLLTKDLWDDACKAFGPTGFGRRVYESIHTGRISSLSFVERNKSNHLEYVTIG
jgi:hypothetical protein